MVVTSYTRGMLEGFANWKRSENECRYAQEDKKSNENQPHDKLDHFVANCR